MLIQPWVSTSVFDGQRLKRECQEGGLFKFYDKCHILSIPNLFFLGFDVDVAF